MIDHLFVRIGGGLESVQELLNGLPGDHIAEDRGYDRYLIVTTNAEFLKFVIENQGYGKCIEL